MSHKEWIGQEVLLFESTRMICLSCKTRFVIPAGGEFECGAGETR